MLHSLKTRWKTAAGWAAALALAAGATAHAQTERAPWAAQVQYVVDGDSLWVRPLDGRRRVKLRLHGVDAPELCQPGGPQAQAALRALAQGQTVHVQVRARDRYGRAVAQVQRSADGVDLAAHQAEQGWAWSDAWGHSPGPYARQQHSAESARHGLFAQTQPERPAAFRRRHGPCARGALGPDVP